MATKTVSLGEIIVLHWCIKKRSNISVNHLYSSADWDQTQLNQSRNKGLTLMKGHSPAALPAPCHTYGRGRTLCIGFIGLSFMRLRVT